MRGLQLLYAACPLLKSAAAKASQVKLSPTINYGNKELRAYPGWDAYLSIEFTFGDDSQVFPAGPLRQLGRVTSFSVGNGRNPGLIMDGAASRFLCGHDIGPPREFVAEPAFKVLKPLDAFGGG